MSKGFGFDLNKCTGCQACIVACQVEKRRRGPNRRQVYTFNELRHPALPLFHLSMSCSHCGEPACLKNCPAKAYRTDETTGAVVPDNDKCMGCKYCTWACPYDAPKYDPARGITEKCDFCIERLEAGQPPACVTACPMGALRIEERHQGGKPAEPRTWGFTDAGVRPGYRIVPLRPRGQKPDCTAATETGYLEGAFRASQPKIPPKISLGSEWALLLFTTIAYILVAFFSAAVITETPLQPVVFLFPGAVAMVATLVHLGRKYRAWRAILNWRTSWLSREILLFSAFMGAAGLYLLFFDGLVVLGWAAFVLGFLSLYSIDKLYQVAMNAGPLSFHSAQVLFNGFFLLAILVKSPLLFVLPGSLKLYLYLYRKFWYLKSKRKISLLMSSLRLGLGFVLPLLYFILDLTDFFNLDLRLPVVAGVILAELIDRGEFYRELDVITPEKQIVLDLDRALG